MRSKGKEKSAKLSRDHLLGKIVEAARTDWEAAAWILDRLHRDEFEPRSQVELKQSIASLPAPATRAEVKPARQGGRRRGCAPSKRCRGSGPKTD